jgi:lactoylglutathione lyase
MNINELNHVAIHVEDVARSCDFYRDILRLEAIPRPAFDFSGAWFRLGKYQELHIIAGRTDPVFGQNRGTHFALLVDDLDRWEQHLQSLNVERMPRKLRPDGAEQIFFSDPDGHCIELCTAPPAATP